MSEQHETRAQDVPPDEDNSVLAAVDGDPGRQPNPDPDAFAEDVEVADPEDAA